MEKKKIKKIVYISLAAAFFFSVCAAFSFQANVASAAKPTKWQNLLVKNGVDPALWQKCLPKVSHAEYKRVVKMAASSPAVNTAATSAETTQPAAETSGSLGPEIAVGLRYFSKSDTFKIDANKAYNIKDGDGSIIFSSVADDSTAKVEFDHDNNLKVSGSFGSNSVSDKVVFDAADGDNSTLIFNTHGSDSYDHYRGKIEVHYYHGDDIYGGNSNTVTQIWVVNKLPLEQYVWGMGETTGTGDADHVRVMTTIFRTYGDWYIENATKYKPLGFKIRSDSNSQIYGGYNWEKDHPHIKEAADDTRGKIVKYKGDVALTPYCSWTDGRTRALGGYPYLKSVKDPYGKKKGLKPGQAGNHMWGLSANGALGYAKHGKSWDWILKYYYTKTDISSAY